MRPDIGQPEPVLITVGVGSGALAEALHRKLRLWSEALCVNCVVTDWDRGTPPPPVPSVLFLEPEETGRPEWLGSLPPTCAVMILSGDERQAIQAYQWHPVSCMEPDMSYRKLCDALDRCFLSWRQGLAWLDLPFRWDRVRVPLCQIRYAEGRGRDTILHCTGGLIRVSVPLSRLEEELPAPPFLRCQKSFIIHPDGVEKQADGELIMKDRQAVSVSRDRKKTVRLLLERWRSERGEGT